MHLNRKMYKALLTLVTIVVVLVVAHAGNAQSGSVTFRSPHTNTTFSYGPGGRSVSGSAYTNGGFGVSYYRNDPNYGYRYGAPYYGGPPPGYQYGGPVYGGGYAPSYSQPMGPGNYGPAIGSTGSVSFRPLANSAFNPQGDYEVRVVNNTPLDLAVKALDPTYGATRGSHIAYHNSTVDFSLRGPVVMQAADTHGGYEQVVGRPIMVDRAGVLTIDMGTTPNYGGFDNRYGDDYGGGYGGFDSSYSGLVEMPTSGYYAPSSRPSCLGSIAIIQAAIDRGQLPSDSAIRVVMEHAQQYGLSDQEMAMMQRVEASLRDLCARRGMPLPPRQDYSRSSTPPVARGSAYPEPRNGHSPFPPVATGGGDGFHNPLLDQPGVQQRGARVVPPPAAGTYTGHFRNQGTESAYVDIYDEGGRYVHTLTIPAGETKRQDGLNGRCKLVITNKHNGQSRTTQAFVDGPDTVNVG